MYYNIRYLSEYNGLTVTETAKFIFSNMVIRIIYLAYTEWSMFNDWDGISFKEIANNIKNGDLENA